MWLYPTEGERRSESGARVSSSMRTAGRVACAHARRWLPGRRAGMVAAMAVLLALAAAPLTRIPGAQAANLHVRVDPLRHGEQRKAAPDTFVLTEEEDSDESSTSDLSNGGMESWDESEISASVELLNVSMNELGEIEFTSNHEELQTLDCSDTSLSRLVVDMSYLVTLIARNNQLSSFKNISLPSTLVSLDLSSNNLSNWDDFEPPRDLQTLNVSDNSFREFSDFNLSDSDIISIDLSNNRLESLVGVVFPINLTSLDLSNNNLKQIVVNQQDWKVLQNLTDLKTDVVNQTSCSTAGATLKTINGDLSVCVLSDEAFVQTYFKSTGTQAYYGLVYLSITVSCLISIWFVVLLLIHVAKRGQHEKEETHHDPLEVSSLTTSRHWSVQGPAEELPNDVRFDPELASFRIDPADVLQIRSLAHGGFAMMSLVHFGNKLAVLKKIAVHRQDRDQVVAFMDEIRVCAKLDHAKIVGFLGITWANLDELAVVAEYVPNGSLAVFLKEKKPTRKSSRSLFMWMKGSGDTPSKLSLALQISEALVYLQSFAPPVIHGNLKAESVLLGEKWEAKLGGIGYNIKTSTLSIDERAWVAPEVLSGGEFADKSDIYSFGVVLSELDRCKRPYSRKESRRYSTESTLPPKPKFRDDCPAEVLELAQRCLQNNPEERPTAMELHYALRQLRRQAEDKQKGLTEM